MLGSVCIIGVCKIVECTQCVHYTWNNVYIVHLHIVVVSTLDTQGTCSRYLYGKKK